MSNNYSEMSTLALKRLLDRMRDGTDNSYQYAQVAKELNARFDILRNKLQETDSPDLSLQKDAIDRDVGLIKYIKNPSDEIKKYAVESDPVAIKYLLAPGEDLQMLAVSRKPEVIQYIENPSETVQIAAVMKDSGAIRFIKKPTGAVKVISISDCGDNIQSINKPDETLQIIAAQNVPSSIIGLKSISDKAQLIAVKNDGNILEYIKGASAYVQRTAIAQNINALKFVTDPQVKAEGVKLLSEKAFQTIKDAFGNLHEKRFFVSEADFQHSLANELRHELELDEAKVYLEFPINHNGKLIYVDIMIEIAGYLFAVELKYKTKCIDKCAQPYENTDIPIKELLKDQGAQDLGGYYFWKDINRIEELVEMGKVAGGVCIFITNDPYYWAGKYQQNTQAGPFRLAEGPHHKGRYDWNVKNADKIAKYVLDNPGFDIKNDYMFHWRKFYEMLPQNGKFMHLLVEVPCAV